MQIGLMRLLRLAVLFLLAVGMPNVLSASAGFAPVDVGRVHVRYDVKLISPAIPAEVVDSAMAELSRPEAANEAFTGELEEQRAYFEQKRTTREYTKSAEYWGGGGDSFRWEIDGRAIAGDGVKVSFLAAPRESVGISMLASSPCPSGDLLVAPFGDRLCSVWMESMPVFHLGFAQPGFPYLPTEGTSTRRTASGVVIEGHSSYPWEQRSNFRVKLMFDSRGRLCGFEQRDEDDGDCEVYRFSDFLRVRQGVDIPRRIEWEKRVVGLAGRKRFGFVQERAVLTVASCDSEVVDAERFALSYPPAGVQVSDYRYRTPSGTLGVSYMYGGIGSVDRVSARMASGR